MWFAQECVCCFSSPLLLCKVLSASIYSSLSSVCSVVLCIMPETCIVVCEFQEETCYACVYIFPSI